MSNYEEVTPICPHCGAEEELVLIQIERVAYTVNLSRHTGDGDVEFECDGSDDRWWKVMDDRGFSCGNCAKGVELDELKYKEDANVATD